MNDYKTLLLKHLAKYKSTVLGVSEDGLWSRNKRPYAHILPSDEADLNLVPGARAIWTAIPLKDRPKTHRDFHHLNSSQAFALNLFLPLLNSPSAHGPMLQALGVSVETIEEWKFEAIPDRIERTNFDVVLQLQRQRRVFIEVKLTEAEFGCVSQSESQRLRRETIYRSRLNSKVDPSALESPTFFSMYQLLRNASYATLDGDEVVFVVPRQNTSVASAAARFISEVVSEEYRAVIRTVFAEDLITTLLKTDLPDSVRLAIKDTADKYLLWKDTV